MSRLARALACSLVAGLAGFAGLGVGAVPAAAGQSRAVVVIDTGAGVRQVTISFAGEISGLEALARAGANPVTSAYSGQGLAVCALDGVGHDPSSCLGTPSDPRYWAYHRASGGATGWTYARGGAGGVSVRDGDVEGWRFGTGAAPRLAVCDVKDCSPPAPAPAPAPPPVGPAGDGGAGAAGAGGSGAAGATAPGAGAATAPTDGSEPGRADGLPDGAAAESAPSTSTQAEARERDRGRDAATRALGLPRPDDDRGAGSPVGVLAAVAIVGAIVGVAFVLRRRGRRPA